MSHENGPVQSVAKALRLLDLLMEAHQTLTQAALSEQTGWPKSTIHGLLSTMRESAVVDRQSDGRYCLGVRLFEYGCAVGASWSVSDLAKPHLQHLASVTGQSVFLSLLNRSEVTTIEQVQSRAGLRVVSEVGTRLPLHCTSQGKVFLSAMADHEAKRVLSRRTLEPYTPKTLVTWEKLCRPRVKTAVPWRMASTASACARPPRPCATAPARCATPSALSACSTVCVRRISSAILT